MAYRKLEKLGIELAAAIEKGDVVLWIHHTDGTSALVGAASVCMNGNSLQIEADPTWQFGRTDEGK